MDMIGADESASQITDKIKDLLYANVSSDKLILGPVVASSLFGDQEVEVDDEEQIETESELGS